jgi:hypothetical protein
LKIKNKCISVCLNGNFLYLYKEMTTVFPTTRPEQRQAFSFKQDFLSTVSMKPVALQKSPIKLEIGAPLPFSQQIYDSIAYDERALDIKRNYEAMGFQAPIRNIQGGPMRHSGLVNNLPKAFNLTPSVLKIGDTPAQLYEKPAKATEGLTPSTPAGDLNLINASKLSALRKKKQSLNKMYDELAYNLGSTQKLRTLDESPLKDKGSSFKGNLVDEPRKLSGSSTEEEFAVSSAELVKLKEASKLLKQ